MRKYKRYEKHLFYLKPIDAIEAMGKIHRNEQGRIVNIKHSSGSGGGLSIREPVLKFFGAGRPLELAFDDYASGRNIFISSEYGRQLFYEEWFYDTKAQMIQDAILPDDMFEI